MHSFEYQNPVRLVFGENSIEKLSSLLKPYKKIMWVFGGGSICSNGVYDEVEKALHGKDWVEFEGILANPDYGQCMQAVELARREEVDFILAVGGGSVLDACKFIAAAIPFAGEHPWDIVLGKEKVEEAVDLGCVLTLPATGSEMNANVVISRRETAEKKAFSSTKVYPKFSILDPRTTFSLPDTQIVNGIVDAFVHVCEQYMTYDVHTPLQDRQAEGVLETLIEYGPQALRHREDYNIRATLMWAATNALNDWLGRGTVHDWSSHGIGHELTALYGLDHAVTLAIVMPRIWLHRLREKEEKLLQFGRRVLELHTHDAADVVRAVERFFHSLGMKTTLADYGIDPNEAAVKVKARFAGARIGEDGGLDENDIYTIVAAC
jgi:NADP-dependent alcohol dehydrogenase